MTRPQNVTCPSDKGRENLPQLSSPCCSPGCLLSTFRSSVKCLCHLTITAEDSQQSLAASNDNHESFLMDTMADLTWLCLFIMDGLIHTRAVKSRIFLTLRGVTQLRTMWFLDSPNGRLGLILPEQAKSPRERAEKCQSFPFLIHVFIWR